MKSRRWVDLCGKWLRSNQGWDSPTYRLPLQTNDPPHRRKKRWLGQFEWITLKGCLEWFFWDIRNRLKLLDVDIWLKAWYKCQWCGSKKEDDGAQLKNFSNLTLFLVTNHITLDSTTALLLPTVFLYGTCSTSLQAPQLFTFSLSTFYIFTQLNFLHFHSAHATVALDRHTKIWPNTLI